MLCPYCGAEMKAGILNGDTRTGIHWKEGTKGSTVMDRICNIGNLTALKHKWSMWFTLESYFCRKCKKMIIDTDVTR